MPTIADITGVELEDVINKVSESFTSGNVMFDEEPPTREAIDSMMKTMTMGMLLALEEEERIIYKLLNL